MRVASSRALKVIDHNSCYNRQLDRLAKANEIEKKQN